MIRSFQGWVTFDRRNQSKSKSPFAAIFNITALITTNVSCAIKPNARSEKAKLRNSLFILTGIVEACCQSGPIRTAKIANVVIIMKTGKLANFKTKIRK